VIDFINSIISAPSYQPPDEAWSSQLPINVIPGVVSSVFGTRARAPSIGNCVQGTSVCGGAPWQRGPDSHREQVAAETMGDTYSDGTAGKFANGAATISYEFTAGYVQRESDLASLATSTAEVLLPGYDLYRCTQTRECSGVVIAIGIVGIIPVGMLASIAGKGILGITRAAIKWRKAKRSVNSAIGEIPRGGTYVLRDPVTGKVARTGRSNDLARRAGEHARDPRTRDLQFEPVHRTDVRSQQRGLEQLLHEQHNPPLNRINPISPRNPRRQEYLDAAEELLRGGGR